MIARESWFRRVSCIPPREAKEPTWIAGWDSDGHDAACEVHLRGIRDNGPYRSGCKLQGCFNMEIAGVSWPLELRKVPGVGHREADGLSQILHVLGADPFKLLQGQSSARVRFVAEDADVVQQPVERPHQAAIAIRVANGDHR